MMTTIIETAVELFKNEYKVKKWDLIKAKEVLSSLGFKIIYFSSSNDADNIFKVFYDRQTNFISLVTRDRTYIFKSYY